MVKTHLNSGKRRRLIRGKMTMLLLLMDENPPHWRTKGWLKLVIGVYNSKHHFIHS